MKKLLMSEIWVLMAILGITTLVCYLIPIPDLFQIVIAGAVTLGASIIFILIAGLVDLFFVPGLDKYIPFALVPVIITIFLAAALACIFALTTPLIFNVSTTRLCLRIFFSIFAAGIVVPTSGIIVDEGAQDSRIFLSRLSVMATLFVTGFASFAILCGLPQLI
jgi:hypothetical protein